MEAVSCLGDCKAQAVQAWQPDAQELFFGFDIPHPDFLIRTRRDEVRAAMRKHNIMDCAAVRRVPQLLGERAFLHPEEVKRALGAARNLYAEHGNRLLLNRLSSVHP